MLNADAIRCQILAIADYAIKNDTQKLPIRAAFRDALERLDRKQVSGVTRLRRRQVPDTPQHFSDGGDAA